MLEENGPRHLHRLVLVLNEAGDHADQLLYEKMALIVRLVLEHVQPDREVAIRRIDEDDVLDPILRHLAEQFLEQIAVGIHDAQPRPRPHIVENHALQHGCLPGARLPD